MKCDLVHALAEHDGGSCACCSAAPTSGFTRRGVLSILAAAGAFGALAPRSPLAASGDYEALLVNCIDPRFATGSARHMERSGLQERYSHFVIAGGPIGVMHPRFSSWSVAFWDNLDITVELHRIKRVVALTHRDCGAARLAFGAEAVATREAETAAHADLLRAFGAEVRRRHPLLTVVAGIMDLDGGVHVVG